MGYWDDTSGSTSQNTNENKSEIAIGTTMQTLHKLLSLSTLILWLSLSTLAMLDAGTVRKSLHVLGIVDSTILNTMMDTAMKKMYNNGKFLQFFFHAFFAILSLVICVNIVDENYINTLWVQDPPGFMESLFITHFKHLLPSSSTVIVDRC